MFINWEPEALDRTGDRLRTALRTGDLDDALMRLEDGLKAALLPDPHLGRGLTALLDERAGELAILRGSPSTLDDMQRVATRLAPRYESRVRRYRRDAALMQRVRNMVNGQETPTSDLEVIFGTPGKLTADQRVKFVTVLRLLESNGELQRAGDRLLPTPSTPSHVRDRPNARHATVWDLGPTEREDFRHWCDDWAVQLELPAEDGLPDYLRIFMTCILNDPSIPRKVVRSILEKVAAASAHEHAASARRELANLALADGDYTAAFEQRRAAGYQYFREFVAFRQVVPDLTVGLTDVLRMGQINSTLTETGHRHRSRVEVEIERLLDEVDGEYSRTRLDTAIQRLYPLKGTGVPPRTHHHYSPFAVDTFVDQIVERYPIQGAWEPVMEEFRGIVRVAEDRMREGLGLPPVGGQWVSEVNLLALVRDAFPELRVVHQGRPRWLAPQSLDIFLPDHDIGIEYQGLQHSQPVSRFGGEEAFRRQVERDARKRELCVQNNLTLIEVHPDYDFGDVVELINSALRKGTSAQGSATTRKR